MRNKSWFEVDRKGLAALVAKKGKIFILHELLQNAFDCPAVKTVVVDMIPVPGEPLVQITITDDDPDGFRDLSHASTLFAPSEKKSNPKLRGRFNLGEKLVLSLCDRAMISTTTGTVLFDKNGRRTTKRCRAWGTEFVATIRMTRAEYVIMLGEVGKIIPPAGILVTVNDKVLARNACTLSFVANLPTVQADEDGNLRNVWCDTDVVLYPLLDGETPTLYEMGIPVVELDAGEPWHIDVHQKVPLSLERDNVTSSYARRLHALMLNQIVKEKVSLTTDQVRAPWISSSLGAGEIHSATVREVVRQRFGSKAVIADPSDREGEHMAVAQGYTVVPGGSFSADAWENIKAYAVLKPAGQVTPSPKPFTPGGKPLVLVYRENWTHNMLAFEAFALAFAKACAQIDLFVTFTLDTGWGFQAAYGLDSETTGHCTFNAGSLGDDWFMVSNYREHVKLLIHELGHHFGHHLDAGYHEALCRIGSAAVAMALRTPLWFAGE